MGTRGWTLSTFLGCCIWILHGLGAAAAPVTTEGPFTVGTAFPITAENEGPSALVTGTAGTSTTAADAEIDESIFTRSPLSSIFPPGTELDSFVTATSEYGSTVPTLMNVTKPLNTSQGIEGGLAASSTATTAAAITAQHPAVTPEAEHEVIEATPDPTLDINPDVKEDIPAAVTRGEEDIDLTTGNMSYPTTPPPADTWVPQPTAGSLVGVSVTVLPSQGLTTAMGAVEEVVTLSVSVQSEANANSLSPSPSTEELLTTQQGGVVSTVEGTNPETAEEMAPAAEESPLASESGDAGDITNGEFSTAGSSHLPPESPVMLETVGNPGESSFLPGHAVLSPDASLAPSTGNGDGQGVSSEASGSALSPAASEAPVAPEETEDTATTLLAPEVPTYAQSDMNLPTVATVLPTGDVGAVGLDNPSLQPDPWQTTREKPPLLPDALMDTPNAPGVAYPLPGAEANTLPAADGAAETLSSPDLTTAPEAPSLGESQPGGMPDGPPQESDGPDTGLSSHSDAPSPALFVPDGLAWPTTGVQGQGAQGAEDMVQAGGPGNGSPYTDTQSDMSLSDIQPSASPANNGELLAEGTGDLASAGQSPPSALGDGTGAGDAPALGEVSSPGSVPPSSAGMEPDLSGAEGPADLPSESASGPGAVYPLPGAVSGPASETETPVSLDLSGAQGAPGSPSFGGLQPWGTAAGAPQGAGLPGAEGPDSGLSSSGDAPTSAIHGLVGPPSPALGDQLGTNLGQPAAGGPGVGMAEGTAEQALEGAGSGIDSESSLSSTAGSGMAAGIDRLPSEGSSSGPASPSDVVAAASVSSGDEAGPISDAPLGPDSLSSASPDSETGPGLGLVEGAESAGDVAQTGNPESPYMETNPSAFSPQEDQLSSAGSSSGPAPPSGEVAASSVSDPFSQSALGGEGNTPGALQPSLDARPGIPAAAGEGASEMAGNGESMGQSQAPTGNGPAGSGTPDEDMGDVLQSVSSSSSAEGSSLPGNTNEAVNKASLPGADGADGGLNTGLEAAGPQEAPVSVPGIQSGANIGLSDGKQSQVDTVQVPEGALVNGGSSPGASLVPVAPDNSGVSDSTATSTAASLLLPEHELSSGLAPNGDTHSAPSTQSGSRPLVPGAPSGLAGESGGISWSLEDELASGMPAPLGEASSHAPISPNSAPVLPSAPQRGNAAEGVSVSPELSAPLAALPAVPLYGYGARENDREYVERRVDFNSPLFKPETGFPFGRTLRNSLYFTDNGQIIFPASDKGIFTYPNPPPGGFNGHEEVPMIAVFWDNADFSRGVGTTFYQEFSTLNTAKPPFVRDVEAKVRRYMRSSYSAAWTLKITWEKAPVYASRSDTRKTITYQAILTTDGFRSYILMLYQDGGMQWDYTRLAATNVLIGYTSGDGFYYNDDLSKRPPAAKYRPDQFRGYNTDLRGLWIYKLESRVGINYRLKCLAWTGQQQEPWAWSQGLPTCPCSLQQGQQDPRFKSSRGGRWAARVSMLHSASPNQHGAGIRCLYDSQNQLIEGRQERYWRSSRQASPYRDQELKLYDWCCNRAGSAHLCARYSEKRPKIGCDGYQSPGIDSSEEIERDSDEEIDGDDK
ncbi:mucin-4-like isoform X2 [Corapipo altera]|uniref:mucin-4-like isoform X2 n=1 Tax=Corapipo altera TaxID=415028 RepID=UPI000FD65406|nr:mucin-4-like isoform X2 [Corapipo altera]